MFSVIIYGRNDSHGYNLHKRAAISFNAIAEVMSDPDDEILFVDYNTPDDHPTFPEAIQDTLTEKAKKVLRIFRVRPEQHVHLKARTHLVALEAQSRNVALRRSNPRNRWILYTNTDMLLVPRDEKQSLSDILGEIPDGFYQVPRFELPEMLWEAAFDRKDAVGNIAKLRDWSRRFHLNQVVHNFMPMRYDALGDFQAALREDMFAIHGFDEEMLLGWHCDSNLAARLALYRGSVDTLVDKVFGYHCDHTRVAAANNKGRQTKMNDQDRFIWDVSTPYLPDQAENWGWPEMEIEEIRLDRDTAFERFSAGISAALEPAAEPYRTTNLEWHLYNDLTYDLPHTLPFVCDQVLTYPRNSALMFVGTRPDFLSRFAVAWRAMGFTGPILVPRECEGLPLDTPGVEAGPFNDLLRRTDMFIFEFGVATQGINEPVRTGRILEAIDEKRLKGVERLFRQAAAREEETRPAHRRLSRRFIGVNVIYNRFWPLFTDYISANINPFCGQVLAGNPRIDPTMKGKVLRLRGRYAI
ncbi:hypothetical protein SAMN02745126_01008 [Enhydrobacter aerosaccus]|uniref:Uncharacterized protein n=1 Tax=Enhydrobacter aerosaccus TaxID=225324 RepID=A0A1T4KJF7_9HYPH|nr:hypothetical protein [Enhydrobacter aerosaccus]SJZ42540.1 hypothetical protein SAMN02745126_01008 [Enhydrobacter aerosaccus]